MGNKTLAKNAGKTAFGTILSRILGYIRDMLVANLFGGGSFSAVFMPVFSEYLPAK
jgi:putative peptidoglycan lipid II flippase